MDLQQAKILIEKIGALHKSVSLNKGHIAAIERDLMLSYIRQLYDVFLDVPANPPIEELPKTQPRNAETEPVRRTYTPPKIIDISDTPKPPAVTAEPVATTQPTTTTQKQETPLQQPSPPITKHTGSADIEALFNHRQTKELSEKLSDRPITDLTKAFAINDKLLYINDLFKKDSSAFNETLLLLNKFDRMEEAKSLLVNLAEQYGWTQEEKIETAQDFIRTIRRRYV
ncbi:MAG TPA: hypothetical protein PKD70_00620 [Saprospiraceae bacterium]|nr:hypothetical protein [Saprospiraceae bacterium]HMP12348.1 hypothetical protein [Saprospiraceae bacterium]